MPGAQEADRQAGKLVVRASHIEDGADPREVASELAAELCIAAEWQHLDAIRVERAGTLAASLARALGTRATSRTIVAVAE